MCSLPKQFLCVSAVSKYGVLFCVLGLILLSGLSHSAQQKKSTKHTIGIIVFDGFLTSDVTAPIEVFGAANKQPEFSDYRVITISASRKKKVTSEEGLTIFADNTIYDDVKVDVLIASSAYDMKPQLGNYALVDYIKSHKASDIWFASNCSGAFLLGEAGILDGRNATTWSGGEKELAKAYPRANVFENQNVVVDEKLVTSNGGPVSYQAAFVLLEKLTSKAFSQKIAESIQYDRLKNAF